MPPKYTTEQYDTRMRMILRHAYEYKLLLGHTTANVFFDGIPQPHALKTMCEDKLLDGMPRAIPGGLSYYVLSQRGYLKIHVTPKASGREMQGPTLDLAIATLWFCCGGKVRRHRLSAEEQAELFDTAIPANVPVVASDELGEAKLFRVVHAASQSPSDTVRKLRQLTDQLGRHVRLGTMVSTKQLGFAVLSPTSKALSDLEKVVQKSGVSKEVPIITGLGPVAETLATAIKEAKGK